MPSRLAAWRRLPPDGLEGALDGVALDRLDLGLELERPPAAACRRLAVVRPAVAVAVPVGQREVARLERAAGAEHGGALDGVPELAHVARPGVVRERVERRRRDAHRMAQPRGGLAGEVGRAGAGTSSGRSRSGGRCRVARR